MQTLCHKIFGWNKQNVSFYKKEFCCLIDVYFVFRRKDREKTKVRLIRMKSFVAVCLVLMSIGFVAGGINFKDCGSKTGTIVDISVTNCTQVPCVFVRGNDYSIKITLKSCN